MHPILMFSKVSMDPTFPCNTNLCLDALLFQKMLLYI